MSSHAETGFCPVYQAIGVLQEKWVLHIVRALLVGEKGFNELARAVGGCNSATLAQRLDHLERLGLIHKTVVSTMPPRSIYTLSTSGQELQGVIEAIGRWARVHLPQELCAPARPA